MYCPYCRRKAMLGATRCSECGRPLSHGNGSYGNQGASGGKIALIIAAVAVAMCFLVLLLIPKKSDDTSLSDRRGDGRNTATETREPKREDEETEIVVPKVTLPVTIPETTEPEATQPEETQPQETKPAEALVYDLFTIYRYQELKEKLAPECIDQRVEATFQYLGDEGELTYEDVCHILGARAASIASLGDNTYQIVAEPYAGARILKAHKSGDTSSLTQDEKDAMNKALEIVGQARKDANSDWELELMLHDWMCDNISYYDVDFSIEFTEKRPLNAIGALLDGKANCQGYTDCFYLLGRMAGFLVDKQSIPGHVFNTIKMGDSWYIVDVTHNDDVFLDEGVSYSYYQYLNVGLADTDGRSWNTDLERNPVPAMSGPYFYYDQWENLGEEHSYQKSFYSIYEAARSVMYEYAEGRMIQHFLVRGTETDSDAMFSALNQVAAETGVIYNGSSLWYVAENGNTYFYIMFA